MHILIELMKRRVRQPSLIKMQGINCIAEFFFDHLDVIDHTIVRTLRQCQNARFFILDLTRERICVDLFLNIFKLKFSQGNGTNNPHMITRGTQKYRDRTGHGNCVQDRLMAVAIDDHNVIGRHVRVPHDFI